MSTGKRLAALTAFFICANVLPAGDHEWTMFPAGPILPAYAVESLSTANRFEVQWVNRAPPGYPWAGGYGRRPLVDIRLGVEVPLIGGESPEWAWYAGMPLSLEVLTDIAQPDTAPVVDTDYWFGTRVEVLRRLPGRWPSNIALRILPVFHESTHIGDEVAMYTADEDPAGHYRVNVSYEAWEIAVGIDEWRGGQDAACTLRLGVSGRWNDAGYYDTPTDAEIGSALAPEDFHKNRRGMEYFGQLHLVVPRGFPSIGPWTFQGGIELRNRIQFDYFTTRPENRAWTFIAAAGWYRYPENWNGRKTGFHLRILGGQNPHGQYREQVGYFVFATGFSLGL